MSPKSSVAIAMKYLYARVLRDIMAMHAIHNAKIQMQNDITKLAHLIKLSNSGVKIALEDMFQLRVLMENLPLQQIVNLNKINAIKQRVGAAEQALNKIYDCVFRHDKPISSVHSANTMKYARAMVKIRMRIHKLNNIISTELILHRFIDLRMQTVMKTIPKGIMFDVSYDINGAIIVD